MGRATAYVEVDSKKASLAQAFHVFRRVQDGENRRRISRDASNLPALGLSKCEETDAHTTLIQANMPNPKCDGSAAERRCDQGTGLVIPPVPGAWLPPDA